MTAPFEKPDRVVRFGGTAGAPTTGEFTEPPSGKKDEGWALDDEPPSSFWNWLTYKSYEWFRWVDQRAFDLASGVGLRIKAPVVDTSADDGGDLELFGADSGADADKSGGDVTIGSGNSTGAGSSTVVIQASSQGAAGAAPRVKENYIRCDGDALMGTTSRGGVIIDRPATIVAPVGSDAPALVVGHLADQHSLILLGDPTAPDSSPLAIVPANADPSVAPETGDIYPNSLSDQLAHYSDELGRFQNLDSVVEATKVDSSTIVNPGSGATFSQTRPIKGGTLRAGSVLRVRAWGAFSHGTASSIGFRAMYGSFAFSGVARTSASANGRWSVEGIAIFRTVGAAGSFSSVNRHETSQGSPASNQQFNMDDALQTGVDTSVDVDVGVRVEAIGDGASDDMTMSALIVEVQ